MKRTTIMLPEKLKVKAENYARKNEMSLGGLIRLALEHELGAKNNNAENLLFDEPAVYDVDVPKDISSKHDDYLYGDGK